MLFCGLMPHWHPWHFCHFNVMVMWWGQGERRPGGCLCLSVCYSSIPGTGSNSGWETLIGQGQHWDRKPGTSQGHSNTHCIFSQRVTINRSFEEFLLSKDLWAERPRCSGVVFIDYIQGLNLDSSPEIYSTASVLPIQRQWNVVLLSYYGNPDRE